MIVLSIEMRKVIVRVKSEGDRGKSKEFIIVNGAIEMNG